MDKRTRAYKIYRAGVDTLVRGSGDSTLLRDDETRMLKAMAGMIDFATAKKVKKTVLAPKSGLAMDLLEELMPAHILPTRQPPYARLAQTMGSAGITYDMIKTVQQYMLAGNWKGEKPTLGCVINCLVTLTDQAVAWESKREAPPNVEFV